MVMTTESQISEVQIQVIKPNDGLVAFASLVLDGKLYLSSIGVHSRLDGSGYRITYPNKKIGMNSLDTFHPINRELSMAIERAILTKVEDVMKNNSEHES